MMRSAEQQRRSNSGRSSLFSLLMLTCCFACFLYFDSRTEMSYALVVARNANATTVLAARLDKEQQQQEILDQQNNNKDDEEYRSSRPSISWKLLWMYLMIPSFLAAFRTSREPSHTPHTTTTSRRTTPQQTNTLRRTVVNQEEVARPCPICLQGFRLGETVKTVRSCRHTFHDVCFDTWIVEQGHTTTCPVCESFAE